MLVHPGDTTQGSLQAFAQVLNVKAGGRGPVALFSGGNRRMAGAFSINGFGRHV